MVKTMAIREAIKTTTPLLLENVIIESDSQIVVNSITCKIKAPKQIFNLITDITNLAKATLLYLISLL